MQGDKNEIAYMFKMSFKQVSFYPNINIIHKEKCIFFQMGSFHTYAKRKIYVFTYKAGNWQVTTDSVQYLN